MRREKIIGGIMDYYDDNDIVEKVACTVDGKSTVYYYNKLPTVLNVGCSSYNCQYGTPVSDDGCKLFVGQWEKRHGLKAYDIKSSSLLWRLPEGKIREIFVYPDYLIVNKTLAAILKLDISSGGILGEIRSGTVENIYNLGSPYVFVDTISGKCAVIDTENFQVVKKYSPKITNPSECLSILIGQVELKDSQLVITGVEKYPYGDNRNLDSIPYSRIIDKNFNDFL